MGILWHRIKSLDIEISDDSLISMSKGFWSHKSQSLLLDIQLFDYQTRSMLPSVCMASGLVDNVVGKVQVLQELHPYWRSDCNGPS